MGTKKGMLLVAVCAMLSLVLLGGCTTQVQRIALETYPAVSADSVVVFDQAPARNSYVEIARVKAENDDGKGLERMKKEAAKLGANALILEGEEFGGPRPAIDIAMNPYKRIRALAIRLKQR